MSMNYGRWKGQYSIIFFEVSVGYIYQSKSRARKCYNRWKGQYLIIFFEIYIIDLLDIVIFKWFCYRKIYRIICVFLIYSYLTFFSKNRISILVLYRICLKLYFLTSRMGLTQWITSCRILILFNLSRTKLIWFIKLLVLILFRWLLIKLPCRRTLNGISLLDINVLYIFLYHLWR